MEISSEQIPAEAVSAQQDIGPQPPEPREPQERVSRKTVWKSFQFI